MFSFDQIHRHLIASLASKSHFYRKIKNKQKKSKNRPFRLMGLIGFTAFTDSDSRVFFNQSKSFELFVFLFMLLSLLSLLL